MKQNPSSKAIHFIGKKRPARQTNSGTWLITIEVEPDAIPAELRDSTPSSDWLFAVVRQGEDGEAVDAEQPEDKKKRRSFDDLPRSQQAALLCDRTDFQEFLSERFAALCVDSSRAAQLLYRHFGIKSRSELSDEKNAAKWLKFSAQFHQWQTDKRYEGMMQ